MRTTVTRPAQAPSGQRANGETQGRLAIFFCAILWSSSGLFIKLLDAHPFVIAGLRSLIAALFMFGFRLLFQRRSIASFAKSIKTGAFWASAIAYSATMILFIIANKLTAPANVILLQYSAPVWSLLLSIILLHEKPRRENIISLVMVFAGLILFFKNSLASGSLLGDLLAVCSGIFFGANSVFMRMQKEGNPADSMMTSHILTAIAAIPFYILYPFAANPSSLFAILFMGFIQIGFSSVLYSYGIKRVSALAALIIACIEPILNPVWVLVVTGERPSPSVILGGIIIILAVIVSAVGKRENPPYPSATSVRPKPPSSGREK
jgi:drug/metabolite transporter (DMT)-like permease